MQRKRATGAGITSTSSRRSPGGRRRVSLAPSAGGPAACGRCAPGRDPCRSRIRRGRRRRVPRRGRSSAASQFFLDRQRLDGDILGSLDLVGEPVGVPRLRIRENASPVNQEPRYLVIGDLVRHVNRLNLRRVPYGVPRRNKHYLFLEIKTNYLNFARFGVVGVSMGSQAQGGDDQGLVGVDQRGFHRRPPCSMPIRTLIAMHLIASGVKRTV